MAVKKTKISKNRFFRIGLMLSTVAVVLASVILFFWFANRALFSSNKHFILKHVEVAGSGWWHGRQNTVMKIIGLQLGKSNLFDMNLRDIRSALEAEPSIAKATAARALPDTLKIKITERIPRAFLESRKSHWVIDSTGVVMSRASCLNLSRRLPIIIYGKGISKRKLCAGLELPQLKPALSLIMLTLTDFPEFSIAGVNMIIQDKMSFVMYYKGMTHKPYSVLMPSSDIRHNLRTLRQAVREAVRVRDPRRNINLMFKNRVVMSNK